MVRRTKTTPLAALAAATALAGGLALGAPGTASAQGYYDYGYDRGHDRPRPNTNTPAIERDQWRQEQQQRRGEAEGRINQRESWRIERAQEDLRRFEAHAKADGYLTPDERRQLIELSRRVDDLISRSYYNERGRPQYGGGGGGYYGGGW